LLAGEEDGSWWVVVLVVVMVVVMVEFGGEGRTRDARSMNEGCHLGLGVGVGVGLGWRLLSTTKGCR
jgi:hypothetical protein